MLYVMEKETAQHLIIHTHIRMLPMQVLRSLAVLHVDVQSCSIWTIYVGSDSIGTHHNMASCRLYTSSSNFHYRR